MDPKFDIKNDSPNPDDVDRDHGTVDYKILNPRGRSIPSRTFIPERSGGSYGVPNILTGTVIVSCFIQTSALPSRIEMQGNDLTFFDDSFEQNGQVMGDTSRMIFTHASGKKGSIVSEGFILEKRASKFDTYDNVLALYALPNAGAKQNVLYLGRDGRSGQTLRVNYIEVTVNHESVPGSSGFPNGKFAVGGAIDGVIAAVPNFEIVHNAQIGIATAGYSVIIRGTGGGVVAFPNGIFLSPGIRWAFGTGSPEGAVAAGVGSLYSNISGGASTTLYVKTGGGSGNTGWTAK